MRTNEEILDMFLLQIKGKDIDTQQLKAQCVMIELLLDIRELLQR